MANINSLTSNSASSTNSLYGTRNILSGLASGMDTEAMIENSISGYRSKITGLQQKQTKIQWQQDAYRDITDKMNSLVNAYTSYTSKTNLMSNAFFTGNVTTTPSSSAVSATGSPTSNIQIDAISSLATAARYSVRADVLNLNGAINSAGEAIEWGAEQTASVLAGSSLTLKVGSNVVDLSFTDADKYNTYSDLANGINQKLSEISVSSKKDGTVKASQVLQARTNGNGTIEFVYTGKDGDAAYISGASGRLAREFGVKGGSLTDAIKSFSLGTDPETGGAKSLIQEMSMQDYLADKSIDVTLDGVTKSIKIDTGDLDFASGASDREKSGQLASALQAKLDSAFGTNRVNVSLSDGGGLDFRVAENSGSTLKVSSKAGEALGIGDKGVGNYLNTSKTLGELLGEDYFDGAADSKDFVLNGVNIGSFTKDSALESVLSAINNSKAGVNAQFSNLTGEFTFSTKDTGSTQKIEFGGGLASDLFAAPDPTQKTLGDLFSDYDWANNDSLTLYGLDNGNGRYYSIEESFSRNDTLQSVMDKLRLSNFNVSFDSNTGQFSFADNNLDGGSGNWTLNFGRPVGDDGEENLDYSLGVSDLFQNSGAAAGSFQAGTDARLTATVNGRTIEMTRSSNVLDMDGMTVTLKETFNTDGTQDSSPITFNTSANAESILDAIRSFVEEYNTIAKTVHDAYTTQPAEKNSKHDRYEPLTEDDKSDMSEQAIANYEEKAKQGLLFADTDLSSLYNRLTSIISPGGDQRKAMEAIGLTTNYSNGVTTLKLDENALRAALNDNPDRVRSVFANTSDSANGLMSRLKSTLEAYASTSYASPGILVSKAGNVRNPSSLLNNTLQKRSDSIQSQIDRWNNIMNKKIDSYTRQNTALEKMVQMMNDQSTAFSNLMGGY